MHKHRSTSYNVSVLSHVTWLRAVTAKQTNQSASTFLGQLQSPFQMRMMEFNTLRWKMQTFYAHNYKQVKMTLAPPAITKHEVHKICIILWRFLARSHVVLCRFKPKIGTPVTLVMGNVQTNFGFSKLFCSRDRSLCGTDRWRQRDGWTDKTRNMADEGGCIIQQHNSPLCWMRTQAAMGPSC